jgi:hypothetical protein
MEKTGRVAEQTSRVAEQTVGSAWDRYQELTEKALLEQEKAYREFWGVVDGVSREIVRQVEGNRVITQRMVEQGAQRAEAYRTLVKQSFETYGNLVTTPFSYYRRGLQVVEDKVEEQAKATGAILPIEDYDELNVNEVREKIEDLNAAQIRAVRNYEKANKNRDTVIEQLDRKLKAVSA